MLCCQDVLFVCIIIQQLKSPHSDRNDVAPVPPLGFMLLRWAQKGLNYVSALSPLPLNTLGRLLIATSNSSSVDHTFLIKFQVNWLRSNIPEAEWQSRSKDDTQLFVREPEQQEKGNFFLPFKCDNSLDCVCALLLFPLHCWPGTQRAKTSMTHRSVWFLALPLSLSAMSVRCIEQ